MKEEKSRSLTPQAVVETPPEAAVGA